ncbi:MAG: hypothetical protein GVY26_03695 [Bacteroidetes bacterium]|jgi:NADH/NAD ratio-sensing transcriptional regulator Rex|nr:hypothetical protein [Bacteroidota bacterium]
MAKKKKDEQDNEQEEAPKVHKDLEGFKIKINEFGEITSSYDVEKLNKFLNKNLEDKKLKNRKEEEE